MPFRAGYDYSFVPTISPKNILQTKIYFGLTDASNEWDLIQPLPNVCCQELETELHASGSTLIIAMHFVPHSQFPPAATLIFERFNAFLEAKPFMSCLRQYPVREVILVIATTECQQQRLTPSPIMLDL